jgi:predicted nucleic acid-binding protein
MIYADTSFLFSLYAWDDNTQAAQAAYAADARLPLLFTPWNRLELRNAVRLAVHRLRRAGEAIPFQPGNIFKRIDEDLAAGRLKHQEPDWRETLRLAEELSDAHTEALGVAAVDLWHVAAALLLRADTFWTFDQEQQTLAKAVGKFRRVPRLK